MKSPEDNSINGLLRRSLAGGAAQDECPGPDVLAAYSERTLEEKEVARCEKHFSQCPRCRELLAAMVRSSVEEEVPQEAAPVTAVAATPARIVEQAAYAEPARGPGRASKEAARVRTSPRALRWWWLAPVTATALLIVVLYLRRSSAPGTSFVKSPEVAMSRSEPGLPAEKNSASAERQFPSAPPAAPATTDTELRKRVETKGADKKSSVENLPSLARNHEPIPAPAPATHAGVPARTGSGAGVGPGASNAVRRGVSPGQRSGYSQGFVGRAGAVGGAAGAAAAGTAVAPPKPAAKAAPSSVPAPPAQTEAVQVEQEAGDLNQLQQQTQAQQLQQEQELTPEDQAATKAKAKSENMRVTVTSAAELISTIVAIPTPDKKVTYRIVGAGFVERTVDGGATWQGQMVSQNADFTAGSAPTPKICWVVGRAGAIFRTSDGSNWKKIPPPASVDLVGVSATDASTATVTAVGGWRYSTENAGKIWVASR